MEDVNRNVALEDIDRETVFHPNTSIADHLHNGPMILANGSGVRVHHHDGREMIDCGAGLWCVNAGYGRSELAETAKDAIETLAYYHLFGGASNPPIIKLAEKVLSLFHEEADARHLSKVFFGLGGSDANDTNFKLVRLYNNLRGLPEKKKIISRTGGYHGLTFAAAALTGIPAYHKAWDLPMDDIIHTSCPHYYRFGLPEETEEQFCDRMIAEITAIIDREGADRIAAFIAEPVMGTGGVLPPPVGYFEKLQPILEQNDILFIVDEVITGFGRTGTWFATGGMKLKPDIVTLAKGITSAYFPLSASVIGEHVWDVLRDASETYGPVMHGFTYSGHPVGGAIGLANLDILARENLCGQAEDVGAYFRTALQQAVGDHPFVGDIRGIGQMNAIEYVADKASKRWFDPKAGAHKIVAAKAAECGVLTRALPFIEVTAFSPPLVMTKAEADEAIARLSRALDLATPQLEALASEGA